MPLCNDDIRTSGLSLRQAALVAGLTYLLNPVTFAEAYVMPRLISADPAETVRNLTAHPHLFSAAVLSYLISAVGDVVMAWALYVLLQPINRALAMLGSVLQLVYAAAWLAALSNLGLIYRLVAVPAYARHTSAAELPVADCRASRSLPLRMGSLVSPLRLASCGDRMADRSVVLPSAMDWLAPLRCRLGVGRQQRRHLPCTGATSCLSSR